MKTAPILNPKGFTLPEMMIVIIIIGILFTSSINMLNNTTAQNKYTIAKNHMQALEIQVSQALHENTVFNSLTDHDKVNYLNTYLGGSYQVTLYASNMFDSKLKDPWSGYYRVIYTSTVFAIVSGGPNGRKDLTDITNPATFCDDFVEVINLTTNTANVTYYGNKYEYRMGDVSN